MLRKSISLRYSIEDCCLFRLSFQAAVQPSRLKLSSDPTYRAYPSPGLSPGSYDALNARTRPGTLLPHPPPPMNQMRGSLCGIRTQTHSLSIDLIPSRSNRLAGVSSKTRSSFGGFLLSGNGRPASRLHRPVEDGTARFYQAPECVLAQQASTRMSSPAISFLSISGGKFAARSAAPR